MNWVKIAMFVTQFKTNVSLIFSALGRYGIFFQLSRGRAAKIFYWRPYTVLEKPAVKLCRCDQPPPKLYVTFFVLVNS